MIEKNLEDLSKEELIKAVKELYAGLGEHLNLILNLETFDLVDTDNFYWQDSFNDVYSDGDKLIEKYHPYCGDSAVERDQEWRYKEYISRIGGEIPTSAEVIDFNNYARASNE